MNQSAKENQTEEEFIYEMNPIPKHSIIINVEKIEKIENGIDKEEGSKKTNLRRKNKSIDVTKKENDIKNDIFNTDDGTNFRFFSYSKKKNEK